MVATNKSLIYSSGQGGQRATGNDSYDSLIRDLAPFCLTHLKFYTVLIWGLNFTYLEKNNASTAQLFIWSLGSLK